MRDEPRSVEVSGLQGPGRALKRVLVGVAALAATFVLLGGLLHLPAARPLLSALGVRCPADKVTVAQVERARAPAVQALRGSREAQVRPALGMALDVLTEPEAQAWAAAHGLSCRTKAKGLHFLVCDQVPAELLGEPAASGSAELTLSFNGQGKLLGVDTFRSGLDSVHAARVLQERSEALRAQLGAPDRVTGAPTADFLAGGAMSTSEVQYRFRNYLVSVQATNLASSGIAVREQYLSASSAL